jgi:hypothetical protein
MDTDNFVAAIAGFIIILFLTWILIADIETLEHSNRDEDHRPTDHDSKDSQIPMAPNVETEILPTNRQNEKSTAEKQYSLDKRRFGIEVLTLVSILAYAGLAYPQWRAMVVANQNTTKALYISERAYVSLGDKNGNTIKLLKLQAGHPVGVKIFLQNSGHILADPVILNAFVGPLINGKRQMTFAWHHIRNCKNRQPFFNSHDGPIPGESVQVRYAHSDEPLSGADLKDFEDHGEDVGIDGSIEYCDGFGEVHCLSFCESYVPPPVDDFRFCMGGNQDFCFKGFGPPGPPESPQQEQREHQEEKPF